MTESKSVYYLSAPLPLTDILTGIQKQIDPADLYSNEERKGLEDNFHITILFGMTSQPSETFTMCVSQFVPSFRIHINALNKFENKDYDILYAEITDKTNTLTKLRAIIEKDTSTVPERPLVLHATIAYLKKDVSAKYLSLIQNVESCVIDKLEVRKHKSVDLVVIPLSVTPVTNAAILIPATLPVTNAAAIQSRKRFTLEEQNPSKYFKH